MESSGARGGGKWEECKPATGMVVIQLIAAAMTLLNRAALVKGMSPRVFIFYRQAVATLFIFPIALFYNRKKGSMCSMGVRSFALIFTLSLIGVVITQNLYFEGLYLASSSIASATANLVPAITFLLTALFGLEKVNIRKWSSRAKIMGTTACVGGAVSIALLKGPKLLNATNSLTFRLGSELPLQHTWFLGCLFLFANTCFWSFWLILQVPASRACPDHLSLSAWTCLMSTLQSGMVAWLLEPDSQAWIMSSSLELTCVIFSGIAGSGLQYVIQSWCIQRRGPLFSAMFNPLSTVIVTVLAAIFLHEQIFVGSLMGSAAVIAGLYVVLWGKSKEVEDRKLVNASIVKTHSNKVEDTCKNDLEQPLIIAQMKCDQNIVS